VVYSSANKPGLLRQVPHHLGPELPPAGAGGPVEVRLGEIVFEVVDEAGGEVEVIPDHLHLVVEVPPAVALSRLVQSSKSHSSEV